MMVKCSYVYNIHNSGGPVASPPNPNKNGCKPEKEKKKYKEAGEER